MIHGFPPLVLHFHVYECFTAVLTAYSLVISLSFSLASGDYIVVDNMTAVGQKLQLSLIKEPYRTGVSLHSTEDGHISM
jgi:hypothetical protein